MEGAGSVEGWGSWEEGAGCGEAYGRRRRLSLHVCTKEASAGRTNTCLEVTFESLIGIKIIGPFSTFH